MHRARKFIYKALSRVKISIRDGYKAIRKVQEIALSPKSALYHAFDRHIMVGNREIPIRVFEPHYQDPISSDIIEHINLNARPQDIELPEEIRAKMAEQEKSSARETLAATIPGVFLFFHGGGWVTGNIDTYSKLCANIADTTGQTLLSVDYRLAPEHPYPAGLDDCRAAVRQVLRFSEESESPISKFTLIGDSAGANLAAATSLAAQNNNELMCEQQILIYPATNSDFTDNTRFKSVIENGEDYLLTQDKLIDYMDLYAPTPELKASPYVAPVQAPDLSGQPRTLIITAEYDPLRDEGEFYGERLAEAGVKVAVYRIHDAVHGFFSSGTATPYGQAAYRLILNFLELDVPIQLVTGSEEVVVEEIVNTLGRSLYDQNTAAEEEPLTLNENIEGI